MRDVNDAIFKTAGDFLGLKEWPGAKHNPKVLKMFADSGHDWVQDDETPWCAAFVGSVLASVGIEGTKRLNARSYLNWGEAGTLETARPGDICVFWRGSPDAATGHVAIYKARKGNKVIVRGGNQGNAVSDAEYPAARLLAVRRPPQAPSAPNPPQTGLAALLSAILGILKGKRK